MFEIPYGRQSLDSRDVEAVRAVLESEFLTQGPIVPLFEGNLQAITGAKYAVAANSATSSLHLACLALGLGQGDLLWTSAITFVASANCARFCGADVDFVDIDPKTYNMSMDHLEAKLRIAAAQGNLPKILVPVHLTGQPCDMKRIKELSLEYGFKVIEDASHAIGGEYENEPIGNCKYSDVTVFSFHPVKIITTGEGGAALTNDEHLASKMRSLRSHGIIRDKQSMKNPMDATWYYEQIELGFNYRLTDIQAALGVSQIQKLSAFVSKRRELAERYFNRLDPERIILPFQMQGTRSAWHLYVIKVNKSQHSRVFETLRQSGINANVHYLPVYRHPYYEKIGYNIYDYPNAEQYISEAMSIPIFPTLSTENQDFVIDTINNLVKQFEVGT